MQKEVVVLIQSMALLVALIIGFQLVAFMPVLPTFFVIGVPFVCSCVLLLTADVKFSVPYFLFIIYCFLCLFILRPDPVFKSPARLFSFAMLLFAVSPMVRNQCLDLFRTTLFKYITYIIVTVSVLSFFCYFLGINYFSTEYSDGYIQDYQGGGGHFSGLFRHSMILGPMSGLSACFCVSSLFEKWDWKMLVLVLLSFGACLLSGSRGALVSSIVGFLVIAIKANSSVIIKKRFFLTFSLLLVTFPLWNGLLGEIESKLTNADREDLGYFDSRTMKFEARWEEIKDSPIIGIGFATIDPNGKDDYDPESGVVEPGSSWLGIISMTGILGLIIFILMVFGPVYNVIKTSSTSFSMYVLSCFALFCIHMTIEGYLLASGSVLAFVLWLSLGVGASSANISK